MVLPAVTLFLAAALLFMVQPMTARQVLPLLGGTPAVWTTCMLFFQLVLLAGYGYAHKAPGRRVHVLLLALAALPLCVAVPPFWNGFQGQAAVIGLLLMLAATIGLPFFVLATTAPLVQRWCAAGGHAGARDPYWLYAASNAGSLVGLLAYPALVEPLLRLGEQRTLWAIGYGVAALATAACALRRGDTPPPAAPAIAAPPARVAAKQRWLWVLLAFAPSSLLLGVTTHLTTNIAPVPLLWAIPFALYLGTFVIAFGRRTAARKVPARSLLPRWLPPFLRWTESPHPVTAILPVLVLPLAALFSWEQAEHGPLLLMLHLGAFAMLALACHGRLADARPEPGALTEYYLWIAVGGALGGITNGLIAPFVFPALLEYPLMLAAACLLLPGPRPGARDLVWGVAVAALAAILLVAIPAGPNSRLIVLGLPTLLVLFVSGHPVRLSLGVAAILLAGTFFHDRPTEVLDRARSIFGAHRVERLSPDVTCLVHGNILHGAQDHRPEHRGEPLTYYHRAGPCGEVFAALAGRIPRRVGAVGLGTGSIAAYGREGERWTFFEIDAAVERTARAHFTFLADSKATVDVKLGDGRLLLAAAADAEFGLLVLDAFNADAVPVHLLTREALAIYLRKLAPGGVLAFHVSSRFVELPPVLADLAHDAGLVARFRQERDLSPEAAAAFRSESKWVVMARDAKDLAGLPWTELAAEPGRRVWTDDHSSLLRVLKIFGR